MRPHDSRYAALSPSNGATDVDGALDCVIMVSPVIDPLGRYHYAKGLRDDITPPESVGERTVAMHDMYWVTEEAMGEAAPARILARGERAELPPTLCLARPYEAAHPRPDLDEFIMRYRKAGGQIDANVLRRGGRRSAAGPFHGRCAAGPRSDDRVHPKKPGVTGQAQNTETNSDGGPAEG